MTVAAASRCAYCGQPVPWGATACQAHRQLLDLDPIYSRETTGARGRLRRAQRDGHAQRAVLLGSSEPTNVVPLNVNSPHHDPPGQDAVAVGA